MKQRINALLPLAVLLWIAPGCSFFAKRHPTQTHITYPIPHVTPWNLDPSTATDEADQKAIRFLSRGLLTLNPNLETIPDLAASPDLHHDHKTLRVCIRSPVTWSDGVLLTPQHFLDGLKRSLSVGNPTPSARAFKKLFSRNCQTHPKLEPCIRIKDQCLLITFQVAADHGLAFLTRPFFFPQRLDVLESSSEKPYRSPKTYPFLGPYQLVDHQPMKLVLHPLNPSLRPIVLTKTDASSNTLKSLFQHNKVHIIEPTPLRLLSDSYWVSHLKAFSDFNLMALLEQPSSPEISLSPFTMHPPIEQYLKTRDLPMSPVPKPLAPIIETCQNLRPKTTIIIHTPKTDSSLIQLVGPQTLFGFLIAEGIQRQLLKTLVRRLEYIPLTPAKLHTYLIQSTPKHALFIFRSRIPSPLAIVEQFSSAETVTAHKSTYYDFVYQKYLDSPPKQRQSAFRDLLTLICKEKSWMTPLLSVPMYGIVHPRITLFSRSGNGVYRIWHDSKPFTQHDTISMTEVLAPPNK